MKTVAVKTFLFLGLSLAFFALSQPAHAAKFEGKMKLLKRKTVDTNFGTDILPEKYDIEITTKKIRGGQRITVSGDYPFGDRVVELRGVGNHAFSLAGEVSVAGLPDGCRMSSTMLLYKFRDYVTYRFTDTIFCNATDMRLQYTYKNKRRIKKKLRNPGNKPGNPNKPGKPDSGRPGKGR